ncbi:MAG: Mth938-like domain-containing protein, partial [Devosiaceae bacterium]|nr:Mth938-like domain-containing protein [Devosiaceae bacterium]
SLEQIDETSLKRVLDQADDIDILLIGLGKEISFLLPQLRECLKDQHIIVEAVATASAISTYNILLGEKRAVAAALISVESARRA